MKHLQNVMQNQFDNMQVGKLFRVNISGETLWDIYLKNMNNFTFRDPNSGYYTCNICKNFFRRYANVVSINSDYSITTIFGATSEIDTEYTKAFEVLDELIKKATIDSVFVESFEELKKLPYESCKKSNTSFRLGFLLTTKIYSKEEADKYGVVQPNKLYEFNHFSLSLRKEHITFDKSVENFNGIAKSNKEVLKRGLDEVETSTLETVIELIEEDIIKDGKSHLNKVKNFLNLKLKYDSLKKEQKDNYCWLSFSNEKFRNELIGVLCVDIQKDGLEEAVKKWNIRVDPSNYMKTKPIITEKQKREATKLIYELGYENSFNRRFATLEDVLKEEILHAAKTDNKISIFDSVPTTSNQSTKIDLDKISKISVEDFLQKIPFSKNLEVYLENRHQKNLVTLTTADNGKNPFKWNNLFNFTFANNLAGVSYIKEAVKEKGGNTNGILNCRLAWNKTGQDKTDLDLWCVQPNGEKIGFSTDFRKDEYNRFSSCGGQLDVDIINPNGKLAVENIYFNFSERLAEGEYKFYVHYYNKNNPQGFEAEIEFMGNTYTYNNDNNTLINVSIASVFYKNGKFTIEHKLPLISETSKSMYNLDSNKFHRVNLFTLSPSFWGENEIGNKYFMFFLKNCRVDKPIRTFHNENLNQELKEAKRLLEIYGEINKISPDSVNYEKQLSGIGFNATVRDNLIVKVDNNIFNVQF